MCVHIYVPDAAQVDVTRVQDMTTRRMQIAADVECTALIVSTTNTSKSCVSGVHMHGQELVLVYIYYYNNQINCSLKCHINAGVSHDQASISSLPYTQIVNVLVSNSIIYGSISCMVCHILNINSCVEQYTLLRKPIFFRAAAFS